MQVFSAFRLSFVRFTSFDCSTGGVELKVPHCATLPPPSSRKRQRHNCRLRRTSGTLCAAKNLSAASEVPPADRIVNRVRTR
eukprot:scaffold213_cov245-Pinguiococcus_pyrenoidosus.AAC.35